MSEITYKDIKGGEVAVYLDGRRVGTIVRNPDFDGSWYYKPKSGPVVGEVHLSIAAVKRSLSC